MVKPPPREMSRNMTGKLMETEAMALAPNLPTQKVSIN
jgi:hypothetical protein